MKMTATARTNDPRRFLLLRRPVRPISSELPYMLLPIRRHIHCAFQGMAILRFEIIPFSVNLVPVRQGVSIRVEIVLMVVDDLPAGLIIIRGAIGIPPTVNVMMPANLIRGGHLVRYIPLELLPGCLLYTSPSPRDCS